MVTNMRALLACALLMLGGLPLNCSAQAASVREQAAELREALQAILHSPQPSRSAYERYFELFPDSTSELQTLFVSDAARALLLQGMPENAIDPYYWHVCKAFEVVGARRYVEKFFPLAIQTGNWGGPPTRDNVDLQAVGSTYQMLLYRGDCAKAESPGLFDAMVAVAERLNDADLERAYVSLGWDGAEGSGMEWNPEQWLFDRICQRNPARCATVRALTQKYHFLVEQNEYEDEH